MQIKVTPPATHDVCTRIQLPSSKSICNRVLIIHALAHGKQPVKNISTCDDTHVIVRALEDMPAAIDIMAAGTAMRFLTAYLSVGKGTHVLTGTQRMKQRPISILVDALRSLGADVEYVENEGFPPLRITGRELDGNAVSLPGNVSSQYISALLMIGPVLKNGLRLTLTGDVVSRPYIDLTLKLMKDFGAEAAWNGENRLEVKSVPYRSHAYYVESDWSAASYWYEICALSDRAEITLPGLFADSMQGDCEVACLFAQLGVETEYADQEVTLRKKGNLPERMDYDFVNQPDLAQTFVVTCALLGIPFRFTGLQSLKIKETDRIAALITEMKKLGYVITESEQSVLSWNGERCSAEERPAIDTYEDHRMAMAFAPACLKVKELRINHPQVVTKSYPNYWEHLAAAGFQITNE